MKKVIVPLLAIILSSCSGSNSSSSTEETFVVGEKVHISSTVTLDEDNMVFDDFVNGVDEEKWLIGAGAWGSGNGGVVPENVSYTEDGILLLRGNGLYYSQDDVKGLGNLKDGRNTGSCLISTFLAGPGHYETKMKPLPRLGACTAFWVYANTANPEGGDNLNQEIDIELPGGKSGGSISFKNVLNTNYITETLNTSKDLNASEVTGGKTINLNDGKFHTFAFDWYTDPEMVVYSIDGYISAVTTSFVPTYQTRLWIGNWFPNNSAFVGDSNFETDYMEVDYVSYIPFSDQPYVAHEAAVSVSGAVSSQYPSSPVIKDDVNMIANGDFEYYERKGTESGYGWTYGKLNGESQEASAVCYASTSGGYDDSACAIIKDKGYLSTIVDSLYEGQSFNLSFKAKSTVSTCSALIRYRNSSGESLSYDTINIGQSDDYMSYSGTFTPPEDAHSLIIQIYSNGEAQTTMVDDFSLTRNY